MAEFDPEKPQKKLALPEAIAKLREIHESLSLVVANLHENIQALDDDPDFQDSLQNLQRDAETRAISLEDEVRRLRSDVKSMKDLLGDNVEKNPRDSS
jgi:hypothetical protein